MCVCCCAQTYGVRVSQSDVEYRYSDVIRKRRIDISTYQKSIYLEWRTLGRSNIGRNINPSFSVSPHYTGTCTLHLHPLDLHEHRIIAHSSKHTTLANTHRSHSFTPFVSLRNLQPTCKVLCLISFQPWNIKRVALDHAIVHAIVQSCLELKDLSSLFHFSLPAPLLILFHFLRF